MVLCLLKKIAAPFIDDDQDNLSRTNRIRKADYMSLTLYSPHQMIQNPSSRIEHAISKSVQECIPCCTGSAGAMSTCNSCELKGYAGRARVILS